MNQDLGKFPSEWQFKTVDEIKSNCKHAIAMGPFGSNIKTESYVSSGVPVIRGTNLNYYKYPDGMFVFVSEQKANELKASLCVPDDLIFTHRGTLGQVGLIPSNKYAKYLVSQSGMKLSVNKEIINPLFAFYFFKSELGQNQLLQYESQVGVPAISNPLTSLKKIILPIPPLAEQRAIASVLSNLDDKIDLLQRQNATLEAMAETLFKQWFVVEAKQEWKEKPLSGVASFLNGLACQKHRPANFVERLPVLKIRELSNGISQDSEWASSTVPKEYIVKFGDVIFSWSGSLMVKIWDGEDCVLNQHLFKVTSPVYPKWFYYFWCKEHLQEFISISESKATTMGHIKRGDLDAAMVKVPKRSEIESMSNIITPYLTKLEENKAQIRTLQKLRDTLLPKLMSGEVRVSLD